MSHALISFDAEELHADGSLRRARYAYSGCPEEGFVVERDGRKYLELGPGYVPLDTAQCGICSTDHARVHLPFPLPQVIGHEIVARDPGGVRVVPEINASHQALAAAQSNSCRLCREGLGNHCPERLVLGIDRLPGGFAPHILVPRHNVVTVPDDLPDDHAVLVEPFAAALHAAETIAGGALKDRIVRSVVDGAASSLAGGERVAVIGAGKLGLLLIAALHALRLEHDLSSTIAAIEPSPLRAERARLLGADEIFSGAAGNDAGKLRNSADIVIEASGRPEGLDLALQMARREVHVKSTTGRTTLGLRHVTELVVDEISLVPFSKVEAERAVRSGKDRIVVYGGFVPEQVQAALREAGLAIERITAEDLSRHGDRKAAIEPAELAIVGSLEDLDRVLRPWQGSERSLVAPRGTIFLSAAAPQQGGLIQRLQEKGLTLSTSRCGDFRRALPVMKTLLTHGFDLAEMVITHYLPANDIQEAMTQSLHPHAIKVVIDHHA